MTKLPLCCAALLWAGSASASVQLYVEEHLGKACIQYRCTAGETVRAFALDVRVDAGAITNVSDFFRGESTAGARGYGIFPTALRDYISIIPGTPINWDRPGYTPLARKSDLPAETLDGLNSAGVTLEFGALWAPEEPATLPPSSGMLCALHLSQAARVSIEVNRARGGVVSVLGTPLVVTLTSALVDPSVTITGATLTDRVVRINFKGGELETADQIEGPWTSTGNTTGIYSELPNLTRVKFFRVHRP